MKEPAEVLLGALVTEKTSLARAEGKYVFKVFLDATKVDIRKAVEKAFRVRVQSVNTAKMKSKTRTFGRTIGRTPQWKKAYVTLEKGQSIKELEGSA
jgi:large subunit ribosomal protein L23